jgi:hypothetical protein
VVLIRKKIYSCNVTGQELKNAFSVKTEVLLTISLAFLLFLPLYLRSRRISFYAFLAALAIYGVVGISRLLKARRHKDKPASPPVSTLKRKLRTILPLQLGLSNLFVSLVLLQWFILYQNRQGVEHFSLSIRDILVYGGGFVSLNLLIQFINSAAARLPKIRFLFNGLLIYLCYLFGAYHFITKSSFDFSVISENMGEAFTMESKEAIVQSAGLWAVFAPLVVIVLLAVLDYFKKINFTRAQEKPTAVKTLSALFLYFVLLVFPIHTMDDVTYFIKTVYDYYTYSSPYAFEHTPDEYPLVKESKSHHCCLKPGEKKPHIFIIMVESFNAGFVESPDPKDRNELLMPVFNDLIKSGIYVEKFYANSIQTCRGQLATLFSIIPSIRGKIFTRHSRLSLLSLPAILKKQGYDTIFFQAPKNLRFDNTDRFMSRNSFNAVETAHSYLDEKEKKQLNGWYMRDSLFYKKFFDFLKSRRKESSQQPVFAVLATTYNHSGFSHIPKDKRLIYPDPQDKAQRYANSIHLSDEDLEAFFGELELMPYLKNSIVIITGDHSYPVGEHGIENNESGFYEESFRIPFLLLWEGKISKEGAIPPKRIDKVAYSQMDIAPTILDILGLDRIRNHFQGVSILENPKGQHPIYLVQPYKGRYLGSVRYPYKLLFHERSGDEFVYNIETDPEETVNLLPVVKQKLLDKLRADIRTIYRGRVLIENNAVWPGD